MKPHLAFSVLTATILLVSPLTGQDPGPTAAQRGALAVRGQPTMNPPLWSVQGYQNVWKQWGLAEKPADFQQTVQQRYGLHPAPYDNGGLPMGLHLAPGFFGKGVVNDCLLCHAGRVAGQTIIGAP